MTDTPDVSASIPFVAVTRPAEHVLLLRLDRPAKRNALTNAMVVALGAILAAAEDDAEVRCAIIAGHEDAFCAGADIAELRETGGAAMSDPRRIAAWRQIERFRKPLLAAVTGIAFGAGNELAMLCDIVIAGGNARFAQPEVKIGVIAGDGGTQRLPRRVGPNLAAFMLLTGEPIDAEAALRAGHVVEVVDTARTLGRTIELAALIASRAPLAVEASKACLRAAAAATPENGLAIEREALWRISQTPDMAEGSRAFVEKRAPRFTGRWTED